MFRIGVQYGFVPFIIYMGMLYNKLEVRGLFILGFRQGADVAPNGEVIPLTFINLLHG